jgi:hypothetical protein
MSLTGKFQTSATDEAKVFVGSFGPMEVPKLYYLLSGGGARELMSDRLDKEAVAYLTRHLPPLTPKEAAGLEDFYITPVTADPVQDDGGVKIFVGCTPSGESLEVMHVKKGLMVLTNDPLDRKALDYLKKHLPPLTAEETKFVANFGVKPAAPAL